MLDLLAKDIIVATATAPGIGGVGIVRLSGAGSRALITAMLDGQDHTRWLGHEDRTVALYTLHEVDTRVALDRVLLLPFASGASFTGEEVVEIHAHGAPVVVNSLVQACCKAGARLAAPGEFTYRAFRSGRIDLTEAEGLLTLANASGRITQEGGLNLLTGGLKREISELRRLLTDLLAQIEVAFDYPEDQPSEYDRATLTKGLEGFADQLRGLVKSWEQQQALVDGWKIVLLGAPNAGKSSLLNGLVGINRALVHATPGTTRDVVEALLVHEGHKFILYDTAGRHDTDEEIEAAGIALANRYIAEADLILHVIDGSKFPSEIDAEILELHRNTPRLVVLSKLDLGAHESLPDWLSLAGFPEHIGVSALTGDGMDTLRARMVAFAQGLAGGGDQAAAQYLTQRQYACLQAALTEIVEAEEAVDLGLPEDLVATHLREVLSQLLTITGEVYDETVLQSIFQQFCVGK